MRCLCAKGGRDERRPVAPGIVMVRLPMTERSAARAVDGTKRRDHPHHKKLQSPRMRTRVANHRYKGKSESRMDSNRRPLRCHPAKQSDQLLGPYAFQRRLMTVLRKGDDELVNPETVLRTTPEEQHEGWHSNHCGQQVDRTSRAPQPARLPRRPPVCDQPKRARKAARTGSR